ncbi:hypothetical protein QA640_23215 [Bradyrhizobium sp. CB82]|uniref:hypothetical protein n=1 Tax=Bradyrhizobium sp. CB82 TaxID=3039159 RepID=UPI0024B10009|nr:hypothetical protein [Bradyrhizobium sp. CB82]WFU45372.1 hypothetical protein QA640_23215 [Bradyrhizobium sp. CB82]
MIGVALIVVLGIVFTVLYKRATRDEAFVRTGLGGKKVVLDGGAMRPAGATATPSCVTTRWRSRKRTSRRGSRPGEDPVKALVGAVTGKSNGVAREVSASVPAAQTDAAE